MGDGNEVELRRGRRPARELDVRGTDSEEKLKPERTQDESARPVRGHLERSPVKHRLIRDIAMNELTQNELSERYHCSRSAISLFKRRHGIEIDRVRENAMDQYAGVWVAKKIERLRAYQDVAEQMLDGRSPRNAEVLVTILKAVAEELGDLPARQQTNIQAENVTYQVVGIDPDSLR